MTHRRGDCSENTDPLKLVREGTTRCSAPSPRPDPARVPVDERRPEHAMVFAAAYAAHLRYFDLDDAEAGHVAGRSSPPTCRRSSRSSAIEDVARLPHDGQGPAALARGPRAARRPAPRHDRGARRGVRLPRHARPPARRAQDATCPHDQPLRATLGNLIRSQLSPMLRRLIGYYLAGDALGVVDRRRATARRHADPGAAGRVVRRPADRPGPVGRLAAGRRARRLGGLRPRVDLPTPTTRAPTGRRPAPVDQVNHLATHNLFTADLRDVPRGVRPGGRRGQGGACEATLRVGRPRAALRPVPGVPAAVRVRPRRGQHASPASTSTSTTARCCGSQKRPAEPGHAHVLVELAKHVDAHLLAAGHAAQGREGRRRRRRALRRRPRPRRQQGGRRRAEEALPPSRRPSRSRSTTTGSSRHPTADVGESWHPFADEGLRGRRAECDRHAAAPRSASPSRPTTSGWPRATRPGHSVACRRPAAAREPDQGSRSGS